MGDYTRQLPIPKQSDLLSREEESQLFMKIDRARSIREKLTELLVLKQQLSNDEEPSLLEDEDDISDEEFYSQYYETTQHAIPPFKYHLLEQYYQESFLERAEAANDDDDDEYPANIRKNIQEQYDLELINDHEIVHHFGFERNILWDILCEGALARDQLVRSNLRLVSSIALRFSKGAPNQKLWTIYHDGWARPGLHEAFQDGVLGLITAVERFESERGLKFATFATYWITKYIRQSFQYASSGALRLPNNIYDKKAQFMALVKSYHDQGQVPPSLATMASQLNVGPKRLSTILRVTRPLKSLDSLVTTTNSLDAFEGLTLAEELLDESEDPAEQVDLSLLRQSLESVMAGELSPHERDVLRLRLGLDDGIDRSVREVESFYDGRLSGYEVRKTEKMALQKLRTPSVLEMYHLDDYFENDKHESMFPNSSSDR